MKKKYIKLLSFINKIFFIIIGSILASIGLELFLIPNNIVDGGITGISIIASYLSKYPLGLCILVLNIPFLVLGFKQIGKTFALTTLFSIACLSISVTYFSMLNVITQDKLLSTVFGGIILGIGIGLIIRNGGSLDGTEIVAIILDKKTEFSIGEIVMFFNLFILGGSGFVFGWDRAMYSLITYFIEYKVIDIVIEGLDETKAVIIVSDQNDKISQEIMSELGRGLTLLDGKGAYKGASLDIIYVIVSRLEIAKLKNIIYTYDENAIITITSVEGNAIKKYKKVNVLKNSNK